jgi:hypothetical protein
MTVREVIDTAAKLGGWYFDHHNAIRRSGPAGPECPITAVAAAVTRRHYALDDWAAAAQAIGLSHEDARALARAADGYDLHILLLTRLFGAVRPVAAHSTRG